MALLTYQNFQTFPDGDTGPWGALTGAGGAAISDTAGTDGAVGPYGETVFLDGRCTFNDGTHRANLSVFLAFRAPLLPDLGNLIEFIDTDAGSEVLYGLRIIPDSTFVPVFESGAIATACDFVLSTDNWNFIQVNLAITDGLLGSLHLVWTVVCDGDTISTGSYDTRSVGALRCNEIRFAGSVPALITGHFGEISIYDSIQAVPFYPHPGTSLARSTNEVIELILVPGEPTPLSGTCPLPGTGAVGVAFSEFVVGSGGLAPYTYADDGGLPPGLSLNPVTGEVSGIPTTPGTYPVDFTITDANLDDVIIHCSITIDTLVVTCPIAIAVIGQPYSHQVTVIGGTPPYTYLLIGTLPPGLSMDAGGLISGTPTTAGSYAWSVQVTDSLAVMVTHDCLIVVGLPCGSTFIPGRG